MNYSVFIKGLKYILLFLSVSILILVIYNNNPVEKEKVFFDFSYNESDFQSVRQILRKPTFVGIDKKNQPHIKTISTCHRFLIYSKKTSSIYLNISRENYFLKS